MDSTTATHLLSRPAAAQNETLSRLGPRPADITQPIQRREASPGTTPTETHSMRRLPRIEQYRLMGAIQPTAHVFRGDSINLLWQQVAPANERSCA